MWKGTNDDTYHEMMNINYRKKIVIYVLHLNEHVNACNASDFNQWRKIE